MSKAGLVPFIFIVDEIGRYNFDVILDTQQRFLNYSQSNPAFFCFLDDVHCLKLSASFAASIFMPDLHCLFHLPSASHRFLEWLQLNMLVTLQSSKEKRQVAVQN